jgi:hypothetical protein
VVKKLPTIIFEQNFVSRCSTSKEHSFICPKPTSEVFWLLDSIGKGYKLKISDPGQGWTFAHKKQIQITPGFFNHCHLKFVFDQSERDFKMREAT